MCNFIRWLLPTFNDIHMRYLWLSYICFFGGAQHKQHNNNKKKPVARSLAQHIFMKFLVGAIMLLK